ncbi:diaminopimelate epimerase [Agilicoccus flavus]|uniref:diaminopimelate epimerase n=1 Tax=Agilicoccus flavus TaxID=2775968 RepID=UPI001CF718EE|nr:diaminopimelate epimerase [Agilicoccus flavus]
MSLHDPETPRPADAPPAAPARREGLGAPGDRPAGAAFTKGHGTENDFVLLPDPDGRLDLDEHAVRRLADRRGGIGGDGVIRVVPTRCSDEPAVRAQADRASWFMDYRNADGSKAEMCGNGTRVFAAYLRRAGWETADEFAIATRAGVKRVQVRGAGATTEYATDLGPWRLADEEMFARQGYDRLVDVPGLGPVPGLSLDLGNPHVVVALPEDVDLAGLDLTAAPAVDPPVPGGVNVELAQPLGDGHLQMRVHERGVGETRSCGTGAAAAALALMLWSGRPREHGTWRVDVPGGTLRVTALPNAGVELAGPADLVADGTTTLVTP